MVITQGENMPAPSYIAKDRHGGYLFRIRTPVELRDAFNGKKVLVKSLRTYHRPTALKMARRLAVEMQDIFDQIMMGENKLEHRMTVAKAKLKVMRSMLAEIESGRINVSNGKILYTDVDQSAEQLEELGDERLETIVTEHTRLQKEIGKYVQKVSDLDYQLKHIHKIKLEKAAEEIEGLRQKPAPENDERISELMEQFAELKRAVTQTKEITDSPLISELFEEFRSEKVIREEWSDKAVIERGGQLRDFLEIIGGDIPASRVDRAIVLKTLEGLAKFPAYRATRWRRFKQLEDIPKDVDKLGKDTQAQRVANLSEFFGWLEKKRKIIPANPFFGNTLERSPTNYAVPSNTDIREWFNLPDDLIENSWQFWIPRVALFSGARVGEIAQLTPNDIKQDKETGIHYILISDEDGKKLKSKAAKRKVPVHQDLIDNGFLTYCDDVRVKGLPSLWPDLKLKGKSLGANVSGYWARLRDVHKVLSEPETEFRERKVFHSLRKVLINELASKAVDLITIQTIVGHEPSLGSTDPYLDRANIRPLNITNKAMQLLKIEKVSWEHPKKFSAVI